MPPMITVAVLEELQKTKSLEDKHKGKGQERRQKQGHQRNSKSLVPIVRTISNTLVCCWWEYKLI